MDGGTVTDPNLEKSIQLGREQREDMALWLALETLLTDDMALADEILTERLIMLQGRLEEKLRAAVTA